MDRLSSCTMYKILSMSISINSFDKDLKSSTVETVLNRRFINYSNKHVVTLTIATNLCLLVMPRKLKSSARNKARKKKKRVCWSAKEDHKTNYSINSVWCEKTKDIVKVTARGKEVLSGWQRCRIENLFDANDEYPHGAVLVQYLGATALTQSRIEAVKSKSSCNVFGV